MNKLFLFALLLCGMADARAQDCNCAEQYRFLTEKMALNYAGYRDKVNPATQADFDRHTALYRERTAAAASDTLCFRLLREWTLFFRDLHVQMGYNQVSEAPEAVRRRFAGWEKIEVDEATARAHLNMPGRDSVEGIWEMKGGNYRVALFRNPGPLRDYAASVLRADSVWWMPGQVKFDLKRTPDGWTARFYMRDHSLREIPAYLSGNDLKFRDLSVWQRVYPGSGTLSPETPAPIFTLTKLDTATLLLTVPTMNGDVRLQLDSLVKANRRLLGATPHLIIDCRGNGGGDDITYYPLKPYLYTQPVTGDRMQLWGTADNAEKFEAIAKNKKYPWTWRMAARRNANRMRRHKGEFIGKTGLYTEKMKRVLPYPQRVVVLIDGGCGSSCEQFVLFARQSRKTTLMGQHTAGVLDYGNLHTLVFPCKQFQLAYPTTRSGRVAAGRGIDNIGVQPAVVLDDKSGDWVEQARVFLHKKAAENGGK